MHYMGRNQPTPAQHQAAKGNRMVQYPGCLPFFYSKHVFSIDKYTSRQRKIATEEVAQWQLPALLSRRWLVRILLRAIIPIFYHFNSALHSINKCNAKCIHKPVSSVVVGKELIYFWIVGSIPCMQLRSCYFFLLTHSELLTWPCYQARWVLHVGC